MDLKQGMAMARLMKERGDEIEQAIRDCQAVGHGVVALRFSHQGTQMEIVVEDEPLGGEVRVYPGD